jgi:hypothetical protein
VGAECIVCGRALKNPESRKIGFGPKCAKKLKLNQAAFDQIAAIREEGLEYSVLSNKTIQILLVSSEPDPQDQTKIKWNYPRGVK